MSPGIAKEPFRIGCSLSRRINGREALQASLHIPYDVIFMDCQMPEMNGYEATRHIRHREEHGHCTPVYIIAMTANAMEGDRDKCITAGMDEYLSKPVRLHELQQALDRCHTANRPYVDRSHSVVALKP